MTCFVVSIVVIGEKASKYRDDRRYRDLPSHVTIMFDHVSPTRRHIGCHPHKFVSYHHTSSGRAGFVCITSAKDEMMEYVTLGKTGLRVSVAGLGCGGNSRLGLGRGKTEAEAIALVRQALDMGLNLLDTAAAYGTEALIGKAIKT